MKIKIAIPLHLFSWLGGKHQLNGKRFYGAASRLYLYRL